MSLYLYDGAREHQIELPSGCRVHMPRLRASAGTVGEVEQLLRQALLSPVGIESFYSLAGNARQVVLVCDDYTRPTPTDVILPALLDELNRCGVNDGEITILVAAGHHREMTDSEKQAKYGRQACQRVRIVHHFSEDDSAMQHVGRTKTGIEVSVNRLLCQADLAIGIGVVEIHPWAGYAGGGKIANPGVAAKHTINATHQLPHDPRVDIGKAHGNPFWETSAESAGMAGLDMVINVLLDVTGKVIALAAGEPVGTQLHLIEQFGRYNELLYPEHADIVVSSAYPKHQSWGQSTIAQFNGTRLVRPGGVRIELSACTEGLGDSEFEQRFYGESLATRHDDIEQYWSDWLGDNGSSARNTCAVYRYLRDLQVSPAAMVTDTLPEGLCNQRVFRTVDQAIAWAMEIVGHTPTVAILPKGGMLLGTVDADAYQSAGHRIDLTGQQMR